MIQILISIPLLIVLIAFALSNQQPVQLGIWPTDIQIEIPVAVAILVASGIFFVVGAFLTWTGTVASRARARRAERQVRDLRAQVESMRQMQHEAQKAELQRVGSGRTVALLPPG